MPGVCMSEKRNKQDYTIFTKTIYIMRNWFPCGTTDVLEFKHFGCTQVSQRVEGICA